MWQIKVLEGLVQQLTGQVLANGYQHRNKKLFVRGKHVKLLKICHFFTSLEDLAIAAPSQKIYALFVPQKTIFLDVQRGCLKTKHNKC
jgi:hypothetical protein